MVASCGVAVGTLLGGLVGNLPDVLAAEGFVKAFGTFLPRSWIYV